MISKDVENFLAQGIKLMGLKLDDQSEVLIRLSNYFNELKKWNKKVNLVGRQQDDQQILENHFLDSLTLVPLLGKEEMTTEVLLDVGTGAGFPGLVLKAACPLLSVVLVEPRRNRYYFLKHIARTLQLDGVKMINVRLETDKLPKELRNRKFTFITSRAFTDIEKFAELTRELLAPAGRIVCMKGPRGQTDLRVFQQQKKFSKVYRVGSKKVKLPFSGVERQLIILQK
jgi:16S rRNA (guanine527-N7)-methyltransferase